MNKVYKFEGQLQWTLDTLCVRCVKKPCPTCKVPAQAFCIGEGITVNYLHMTRVLLTFPNIKRILVLK